jgi:hypothetical protein
VGKAAHTAVGGPSGGEANRINGGSVGVLAGPAAGDLEVRGNLIGTDATGTATLAPPGEGIVVDSAELSSPMLEAEIAGNEIRMEAGVAIEQIGQGAWIFANRIFGSTAAIKTIGLSNGYGNVIEENSIEGPAATGILIESDLNEVLGNEIFGAGGAGIWVQGLPLGVGGNLIGGDTPGDENLIADSGGDAIEISNIEATRNDVLRNQGVSNGGLFINLVPAFAATEIGPNEGIQPPVFATATQVGASGTAEVEATVRIFRKQVPAAGELDSFLGEAIADSGGHWEIAFGSPIPAGAIVAATQTSKFGGTSELATAMVPGGGGSEGGADESSGAAGAIPLAFRIRVHPRTKILEGPRRLRRAVARFEFESDEPDSVFLCRLDGKPFDLCRSPRRYRGLKPGKHLFEVRAVDSDGHADPSPARKRFAVLGKP